MISKVYWNQFRVHFFALAVYFPERLIGNTFTSEELNVIFPDGYDSFITVEKLNKSSRRIISLNLAGITELFDEYLKDFYYDKLTTMKSSKPERAGALILKLFETVTAMKSVYGTSPIIKLINIWPEQEERSEGMTPFWELIFSEARIGSEFSLVNFDHDGVYLDKDKQRSPLPFAEIKLNFGSVMYQAITYIPRLQVPTVPKVFNTALELRSNGLVVVRDNEEVLLKRLQSGKQYYNFVSYLVQHPDEIISLDDIRDEVTGAKTANDLTELVRMSGFRPMDKKRFFSKLSSDCLQFNLRTNLTREEFDELKNRK